MFLTNLLQSNASFVEASLNLYRKRLIPPNSYVLDIDQIEQNAAMLLQTSREVGMELYFMTKQIGRNPVAVRALQEAGIKKAVAVDAEEAMTLIGQGVQLGNVGHLVQISAYYLSRILQAKPEVMTVFNMEAVRRISAEAKKMNMTQDLLLRVRRPEDFFYNGQAGGFLIAELSKNVSEIRTLPNVRITGVTSFPNLLVKNGVAVPTENIRTLGTAAEQLRELGVDIQQINVPSVTCISTLPMLREYGGTHAEPGHGLTGTTPLHTEGGQPEKPAYLYITEVSHHYDNMSYVYGGGTYNRGNLQRALVGNSIIGSELADVAELECGIIDYYVPLKGLYPIGTPVVMAFRTQMFVTRANVVPLRGLKSLKERLEGIFAANGQRIDY